MTEARPAPSHRVAFAATLLAAALLPFACTPLAPAQDRAEQKRLLQLQATEFCAVVRQPPAVLGEAIQNALAQDPKTWFPAAVWWNRIVERYQTAGCADA